jgi:hypothetical protein
VKLVPREEEKFINQDQSSNHRRTRYHHHCDHCAKIKMMNNAQDSVKNTNAQVGHQVSDSATHDLEKPSEWSREEEQRAAQIDSHDQNLMSQIGTQDKDTFSTEKDSINVEGIQNTAENSKNAMFKATGGDKDAGTSRDRTDPNVRESTTQTTHNTTDVAS